MKVLMYAPLFQWQNHLGSFLNAKNATASEKNTNKRSHRVILSSSHGALKLKAALVLPLEVSELQWSSNRV